MSGSFATIEKLKRGLRRSEATPKRAGGQTVAQRRARQRSDSPAAYANGQGIRAARAASSPRNHSASFREIPRQNGAAADL